MWEEAEIEKPEIGREEIERAIDSRFSPGVQEKLKNATVGVAGLGGLGSHIAIMLARCFVGHLLLVDYDLVDITNLNRQAYGITHLGMKKTEAMVQILNNINPYLNVRTEFVKVTEKNIKQIFRDCPIVCEAFDRPEEKAMLVNGLLEQCPDTVIISGNGMAGYGNGNEIQVKKIMNRLYQCGDGRTDIGEGVGLMAPRVNICAGQQANTAVGLILGREKEI